MKKYLGLALFFALSANNVFGSPLVFKAMREIDSKGEFADLATVDALKLEQIRLKIKFTPKTSISEFSFAIYAVEGDEEIFLSSDF